MDALQKYAFDPANFEDKYPAGGIVRPRAPVLLPEQERDVAEPDPYFPDKKPVKRDLDWEYNPDRGDDDTLQKLIVRVSKGKKKAVDALENYEKAVVDSAVKYYVNQGVWKKGFGKRSYDDKLAGLQKCLDYTNGEEEAVPAPAPTPTKGKKKVSGKGVLVGGGISTDNTKVIGDRTFRETTYIPFGLFALHERQLLDDDILNVKYAKNLNQVAYIRRQRISKAFKNFLINVLQEGKVFQRDFDELPLADQLIFTSLATKAGLRASLKFDASSAKDKIVGTEGDDDMKKYTMLKGELISGNTNKMIKDELKTLILKLINDKRVDKKEGFRVLELII